MPIRLVIADEQPVARAGIKAMLTHSDISDVGEASTGEQVVEQAIDRAPDAMLCLSDRTQVAVWAVRERLV